jgi:hypothetical protein
MLHKIRTRTLEECEELARQWTAGSREEVIEVLGGEPTEDFLSRFESVLPALEEPISQSPEPKKRRTYGKKTKATE